MYYAMRLVNAELVEILFLQKGCPAIAVSSQWFIENMDNQEITHTPKDNLSIVDYNKVAECAIAIKEFLCNL